MGTADAVPIPEPVKVTKVSSGVQIDTQTDTDGDGVPDFRDNDDDGDGIPDHLDIDSNNNGIPDDLEKDTDGDGIPDYLDDDDDNDGIDDIYDDDDDGDGVLDVDEVYWKDTDGDGIPDWEDDDDDNDGIPDSEDDDDDGDGIPDEQEDPNELRRANVKCDQENCDEVNEEPEESIYDRVIGGLKSFLLMEGDEELQPEPAVEEDLDLWELMTSWVLGNDHITKAKTETSKTSDKNSDGPATTGTSRKLLSINDETDTGRPEQVKEKFAVNGARVKTSFPGDESAQEDAGDAHSDFLSEDEEKKVEVEKEKNEPQREQLSFKYVVNRLHEYWDQLIRPLIQDDKDTSR